VTDLKKKKRKRQTNPRSGERVKNKYKSKTHNMKKDGSGKKCTALWRSISQKAEKALQER